MGLFGGDGRHMLTIQASKIQGHGKYIWYLTYIVYCWRQKIARNRSFPLPILQDSSKRSRNSINTNQLLALPVHALTQS